MTKRFYIKYIIVTFFLLLACLPNLKAQDCSISGSVSITDNDTSFISLVVDQLVNNDMSDPGQGVCAVLLSFRHDAIGDLEISLVSPSGQSVLLMGPGVSNSQPTAFTNWENIAFIPCSNPPNPAAGTSPQWNNLDNWGFFFDYSNLAYHPNQGCLEDINMGPANGVWTLQIIDGAVFDDGIIVDFEIFFCDSNGLDCNDCSADGGVLPIGDVIACEGSNDLANNIPAVYPGGFSPDPSFYSYSYVVSSLDTITTFLDQSDFRSLSAGQYTICGMSYLENQLESFPSSGISVDSFNIIMGLNSFCGDLSDNCFELEIRSIPDTIFIDETICLGDSLLFRNEYFQIAGTYDFVDSLDFCEQITSLTLEVRQVQSIIDLNIPFLSCTQDTIILDASNSITGGNGMFSWSTNNGNIISSTIGDSIVVNSIGTYTVTLEEDGCVSTDMVTVQADDSVPNAQFNFNEINCNFDSSFIDASFNRPIVSYKWLFENDSIAMTEDIVVADSGTYMLEVIADNGCEATFNINIAENFETASPDLSVIDIDCNNPNVNIEVANTSNGQHQWFYNDLFISNQVSPSVNLPGEYKLIISESNGCLDSFFITVEIDTLSPETNLMVPEITCANPQATVIASSSSPAIFTYFGTGIVSQDSTMAIIDQPGNFTVNALGDNGCINDTSFVIMPDVNFPVFDVQDGFIDCGEDSIQINNNVSTPGVNFSWTGPAGYTSNDPEPFIYSSGFYYVVGETNNGCSVFDTIEVLLNPSIPVIRFTRDTLDCNTETVTIIPDVTNDLLFDWTGPNFTANTPEITVDSAGTYRVTVTDVNDTNCTARRSVRIIDDFEPPMYNVSVKPLDCNIDSVFINISSITRIVSYIWSDDNGVISTNKDDLEVFAAGDYYLETTGANGCKRNDTITVLRSTLSPQISVPFVEINCNEPTPSLQVVSTDSIVSYTWTSSENNFSSSLESPVVQDSGKYYIEVVGLTGCSTIDSVIVSIDTISPTVVVEGNNFISCESPQSFLNLTSNESNAIYTWVLEDGSQNNSSQLVVEDEGFYTYIVTAPNDCSRLDSVFIENINTQAFGLLEATQIDCYSDEAIITISGVSSATEFIWTSPTGMNRMESSFSTTELGFHYIELTTEEGCVTLDSVEVVENKVVPVLPVFMDDTLSCNIPILNYDISLIDPIDSLLWTRDGLNYSTETNLDITEDGLYEYMVWSDNGCTDIQSFNIEVDTLKPTVQLIGGSVSCNESKLLLQTVLGPEVIDFEWIGPNNFSSTELEPIVKDPGLYTILLTGVNGCIDSSIVEVINDLIPPDVSQIDQFLPCDNNPLTLSIPNASSGVDVSWFGPGNFFSELLSPSVTLPGEYFVFATGDNGCIGRDTFNVLDIPIPPVFSANNVLLDCNNLAQTLSSIDTDDDMLVEWFDPQGQLLTGENPQVTEVGVYDLVVTGNNFCKDTLEVIVDIDTISPMAIIVNDDFLLCNQTSYSISAVGSIPISGVSYNWSTSDGQIIGGNTNIEVEVAAIGSYELLVTNNINGCTDLAQTTVVNGVEEPITYNVEEISPSCIGLSDGLIDVTNVNGSYPPFSFSIDGNPSQSDSLISNLSAGVYSITVFDRFGCSEEQQVIVTDGTDILLDLGSDLTVNLGDSVTLQAVLNIDISTLDTTVWNSYVLDSICDFCLDPTIVPLESGSYQLTVIDMNDCTESDDIYITVDERQDVYIPNIFSPNGDDVNDQFILGASKGLRLINSFKIFDNWGNKVYQLDDFHPDLISGGWDGTFKNKDLNPAVFTYMIDFTLINGDKVFDTGSITLVR